jgi:hypothetical protein
MQHHAHLFFSVPVILTTFRGRQAIKPYYLSKKYMLSAFLNHITLLLFGAHIQTTAFDSGN